MKNFLFLLSLSLFISCGVRNDPIPPGTQAEIGKGRPEPKAWLKKRTKNLDPTKIQILDDLEDESSENKKNDQ
jgi:hypothetical protein